MNDITVKAFDEKKAKQEIKNCPKIVRDYFKLITESRDRWEELTKKAIAKLKARCEKCKI